jgi:hypothetical protein
MQGMILPGDGNGEHSLPGPVIPFRGWTEGRPRESAGERWRGPDGYDFRPGPRVLILSCNPTTLGILLRPSIGRCAYVQKPGRTGVSWLRGSRRPERRIVPAYRPPRFRDLPGCGPSKPPQRTFSWRMTCLACLKKQSAYQELLEAVSCQNGGNVKVSPPAGRGMAASGTQCPTIADKVKRIGMAQDAAAGQRAVATPAAMGAAGPDTNPDVTDW